MSIAYETVKYYQGAPNTTAGGFGNQAHYDRKPSPIARAGSTQTILGQGGLLDVAGGISRDLQSGSVLGLIGAAQKAGTAVNTFKGANLKSTVISEATALGVTVLQGSLAGAVPQLANIPLSGGAYFPTPTVARNQTTVNPGRVLGDVVTGAGI
jgi:hypothetical protein